jgi:DNA polymerase
LALKKLNRKIRRCKKCRLWKNAKNAVPGEGPSYAKAMLVGQNPGKTEDETGRPFVGRAGKFLNKILYKNGINREDLFITNVVKHKTPQNRKPRADEIKTCMPYLKEQIRYVKPEIIVLMGKVASQTPRGENMKCIETCHPAAAMRFPKMRKEFEEDFEILSRLMTN